MMLVSGCSFLGRLVMFQSPCDFSRYVLHVMPPTIYTLLIYLIHDMCAALLVLETPRPLTSI